MSIEKHKEPKDRAKLLALRVIKMSDALPQTPNANAVASQILRSATSTAANYRAVGRARSKAEFLFKRGIVIEKGEETVFWLELLVDGAIVPPPRLGPLLDEAKQLLFIFSASRRTAKA